MLLRDYKSSVQEMNYNLWGGECKQYFCRIVCLKIIRSILFYSACTRPTLIECKVAKSPAFCGRLTHFALTSSSPPHWQLSHARKLSHAFLPHSKFGQNSLIRIG